MNTGQITMVLVKLSQRKCKVRRGICYEARHSSVSTKAKITKTRVLLIYTFAISNAM